jgi:hypothetical protein
MKTSYWLAAVMLAGACGGGSSSSNDFSLAVSNGAWNWNGGGAPPSGDQWFQATATLTNHSAKTPLSESSDDFSVQTETGLTIGATGVQPSALPGACMAGQTVAVGATGTCNLVFELPTGSQPTALLYRDSLGRQSSAMLNVPQPSPSACVAKLATVPQVEMQSPPCSGCWTMHCMAPDSSCQLPASCGGAHYCSAECPQTTACDATVSTFLDCVAQYCAQECG